MNFKIFLKIFLILIFNLIISINDICVYAENESKFQYIASLDWNGIQYCGGTLISKDWVLTAAHCLYDVPANELMVRIGSIYSNKGGFFVNATETRIYDDKYVNSYFDDVGLIKISKAIESQYAKLPEVGDYPIEGSRIKILGYGQLNQGGENSLNLLSVDIPVISQEICRKPYRELITDNMFCAYGDENDACQGDAGGPALLDDIQYGIISWGLGCSRPNAPGVYTQIANSWIRSWIYRNTGV